jgi:hypothetical protein
MLVYKIMQQTIFTFYNDVSSTDLHRIFKIYKYKKVCKIGPKTSFRFYGVNLTDLQLELEFQKILTL